MLEHAVGDEKDTITVWNGGELTMEISRSHYHDHRVIRVEYAVLDEEGRSVPCLSIWTPEDARKIAMRLLALASG